MPCPSARATAAPISTPPAPGPTPEPTAPPCPDQVETRHSFFSPGRHPRRNSPMHVMRHELDTPQVSDSTRRVFTAKGRSCAEGYRTELGSGLGPIVLRLEPVPGSPNWLQVLLRDAE